MLILSESTGRLRRDDDISNQRSIIQHQTQPNQQTEIEKQDFAVSVCAGESVYDRHIQK